MPPALPYALCDVFTDRPLTGNALAVFTRAEGLSEATLQAVAREMNLSECAFVTEQASAARDARIRIFTPTMELPFAGHPTLGAAFVLGMAERRPSVRLATGRGAIDTRWIWTTGRLAFGWMTQPLPRIEAVEGAGELLGALGVEASMSPIELYDNGPHYAFVEVATRAECVALRPDMRRLAALGSTAFVVFTGEGGRWKCRVFAPGEGISEDPATGAAAGPLAVHLARHRRIQFGDEIAIEQGAEIGRPSLLHARARGASIGSRASRSVARWSPSAGAS